MPLWRESAASCDLTFFEDFDTISFPDLYLMHWPDTHVPGKSNQEVRAETWRAMEELYEKGNVIIKNLSLQKELQYVLGFGKSVMKGV